jgi:hypothetical protein
MKPEDPTGVLLPVLERIAAALEKIDSRLEGLERFERTARWYDQFLQLTTAVSDDSVATMKTDGLEAVPLHYLNEMKAKFNENSPELEAWFRKVLFFQRIYEYLFATIAYSNWSRVLFEEDKAQRLELIAGLRDEEHAVLRWIQELVRDPDFRMVHVRQGQYYPKFALIVDKVLDQAAIAAVERGEARLAKEIRTAQDWAKSEIEFDAFCKLDPADPNCRHIRDFIQSKGYNPSKKEDFRFIRVNFPGFRERNPDEGKTN